MKHFYSFAIALLAVILSSAPTTAKGANISINSTNFPDYYFRNWLLKQNYGQDGVLTDSEIKGVTEIYVSQKQIKSLKGIEYFTSLTRLTCGNNQLISLDVSKNMALTDLYCRDNKLTSLNLSKNTALTILDCRYNQLTTLDVSKNTALKELNCWYNQLTSLDVTKNTALTTLWCAGNQLTSLDVSKNTALIWLDCERNQLTSLDVSKNTALIWLNCSSNQLTSLDVSKNTALIRLNCSSNQLTSLDVSKNTALKSLYCQRNKIKGGNMDDLISGLQQNATTSTYNFNVIDNREGDEGNVCTKSQVAAVKAKGWTPLYYDATEKDWKVYEGSEDESPALKGDVNGDGEGERY